MHQTPRKWQMSESKKKGGKKNIWKSNSYALTHTERTAPYDARALWLKSQQHWMITQWARTDVIHWANGTTECPEPKTNQQKKKNQNDTYSVAQGRKLSVCHVDCVFHTILILFQFSRVHDFSRIFDRFSAILFKLNDKIGLFVGRVFQFLQNRLEMRAFSFVARRQYSTNIQTVQIKATRLTLNPLRFALLCFVFRFYSVSSSLRIHFTFP